MTEAHKLLHEHSLELQKQPFVLLFSAELPLTLVASIFFKVETIGRKCLQ